MNRGDILKQGRVQKTMSCCQSHIRFLPLISRLFNQDQAEGCELRLQPVSYKRAGMSARNIEITVADRQIYTLAHINTKVQLSADVLELS